MGLKGSQRATKVGYSYTPSNYTPDPVYSESTNKVSAHLKGIDNALGGGISASASAIGVDTSNFDGFILDSDDTDVQRALDTLDDHDHYMEGTIDERPEAGIEGRWFRATDEKRFYADNGVEWIEMCCEGTGAPTIYERHAATANQTVFDLSSYYDLGVNALQVFVNGQRQTEGASYDYQETDTDTITFNSGLDAGDEVILIQHAGGAKSVITARQDFTSTLGQTVFNLSFTYNTGMNDILVYSSGILQKVGSTDDYVETDEDTITFNSGRAAGERVTVLRVGANEAGVVGLYEKHTATGGQTVFDLSGTYPVGTHSLLVFKNGQLLTITDDYAETDGDTVTLTAGALAGDKLVFRVMNGDTELCSHDLDFHSDVTTDGADAFVAAQDEGADSDNRFALMSDFGAAGSFFGWHSGIYITVNSGNPTYQVDIAKGLVCINDDLDGTIKTTATLTVDITASGANGLDTGSEASDTWYYIWVIKNLTSGVVAGLLSTSATSPTMPSGYTKKRLVGCVRNDNSSNFLKFLQHNEVYKYAFRHSLVAGGTATSYATIDCSSFAPPNLVSVLQIHADVLWLVNANYTLNLQISGDGVNNYSTGYARYNTGGDRVRNEWDCEPPCFSPATPNVYYLVTSANGRANVSIHGFVLRL